MYERKISEASIDEKEIWKTGTKIFIQLYRGRNDDSLKLLGNFNFYFSFTAILVSLLLFAILYGAFVSSYSFFATIYRDS